MQKGSRQVNPASIATISLTIPAFLLADFAPMHGGVAELSST